jgi:hypothetical protein
MAAHAHIQARSLRHTHAHAFAHSHTYMYTRSHAHTRAQIEGLDSAPELFERWLEKAHGELDEEVLPTV